MQGDRVMISNRKESFRYVFKTPLPALFTIEKVADKKVTTAEGEAHIIDLSPKGMKIISKLNIPTKHEKDIHLSIAFELNNTTLGYVGKLIWKNEKHPLYEYGIHLITDESEQREVINQLKHYAKHTQTNSTPLT